MDEDEDAPARQAIACHFEHTATNVYHATFVVLTLLGSCGASQGHATVHREIFYCTCMEIIDKEGMEYSMRKSSKR
jgi:hypothetical protein